MSRRSTGGRLVTIVAQFEIDPLVEDRGRHDPSVAKRLDAPLHLGGEIVDGDGR